MSALSQGGVRYTSYRFPGFVLSVWNSPITCHSHLKTVFDEDLFVVVPGHDDTQPIDLLPRHLAESLMQHEGLFYFFPNTCHDT
jgi:hypothetical protein